MRRRYSEQIETDENDRCESQTNQSEFTENKFQYNMRQTLKRRSTSPMDCSQTNKEYLSRARLNNLNNKENSFVRRRQDVVSRSENKEEYSRLSSSNRKNIENSLGTHISSSPLDCSDIFEETNNTSRKMNKQKLIFRKSLYSKRLNKKQTTKENLASLTSRAPTRTSIFAGSRRMHNSISSILTILAVTIIVLSSKQNLLGLSSNSKMFVEAQKDPAQDQPLLFCQPNKMFVNITKSYLRRHNIEIKSASQLFFRGHSTCFAQEENNAYILSLFNPFTACGTELEHTSEDYIYTNQVVLDRRDGNGATKLLEMRCVYEDKYIVSSGPITPTKNTLTFTTEFGEFETKMTLYNNSRFDSLAELNDRPSVQLGDTVYVAVSMFIPFNPDYQNDFTITLKSCFANHDPNHTNMETYHYLISGMCASPADKTVSIYQNGAYSQTEARFSFDMFKFRKGFDYIYLHCEVKLCNSTAEICNGDDLGEQCNGRPLDQNEDNKTKRRKRSLKLGDIQELKTTSSFVYNKDSRRKRAVENEMADPQDDTLAYLSRGPLVMETATRETNAEKSGLSVTLDDLRFEQSFLRLWVFSGVAAVIGIIGVILTMVTIYKRRSERIKLQTNGTVITAPTLAAKTTTQWRQGPLPTVPPTGAKTGDGEEDS